MALADTAKLVASLVLEDKFTGPARKAEGSLDRLSNKTRTLGQVGGQVSSGIGSAVQNLGRLALVGVGVVGVNVAAGIASLQRLEEVTVATSAVIESTGGVAGVTAQQVRELAEEYESLNATMDDKVIQSAENLLLTFTNIGSDAFEPALEAALNLNQVLGGGEEGLQGNLTLVAKALNDPIKGLTALGRKGVIFTAQQKAQIKTLVEQNRIFEAQEIILGELSNRFGGQFAAAGDTATAKFAKFKDAIEDSQMALATAFLPVLEKVSVKLTDLLADPATQDAIADFGVTMADAFDSVVELAGNLPWESIGNAFKLMGTGSKALLDAFTGLPPWVQTAVLTGWGLNKLTGGALTGIVGALASGLVRGILGIQAGTVHVTAATATVGGAGGAPIAGAAGGRGAGVGNVIRVVGTAAIFTGIAVALGELVAQNITRPLNPTQFDFNQIAGASGMFNRPEQADELVRQLSSELGITQTEIKNTIVAAVNQQGLTFQEAVRGLQGKLVRPAEDTAARLREAETEDHRQTAQLTANLNAVRDANRQRTADAARHLQAQAQANMKLQQIANKDFSPRVSVSVVSNVTISEIQRKITSQQIAVGKGPLEF